MNNARQMLHCVTWTLNEWTRLTPKWWRLPWGIRHWSIESNQRSRRSTLRSVPLSCKMIAWKFLITCMVFSRHNSTPDVYWEMKVKMIENSLCCAALHWNVPNPKSIKDAGITADYNLLFTLSIRLCIHVQWTPVRRLNHLHQIRT